MRKHWLLLGVAASVLVAPILVAATRQAQHPLFAASAPVYVWNEPFLDWPQTGDMACEAEGGPCAPNDPPITTPASGTRLEIARLAVPVGGPGRHELPIGELILPNGVHTRTIFRIANGDTTVYRVAQTHIEFESMEPGAPPFTEFAAQRPPVAGPERVRAILVWTTDWSTSDAVMELTGISIE